MSGDLLALGTVAALAAAGLARRGSRAVGGWTYNISYSEMDDEAMIVESGYIVDGQAIAMPEHVYGDAALRWEQKHGVNQVLELADDSDVEAALGIDLDEVVVPDWVRAAVTFLGLLVYHGADPNGGEPGESWIVEYQLCMDSGREREMLFTLEDVKLRTLEGLYDYTWPDLAYELIDALLAKKLAWTPVYEAEADNRVAGALVGLEPYLRKRT